MPDDIDQKPPGGESPVPEPEPAPTKRKKRKRSLKIDKDKVVEWVLSTLDENMNGREEKIRRRKERYLQIRGWLEEKTWPWEDCSNIWLPIMLTVEHRMKATLENATKGVRPISQAHALQRRNISKQERIDNVLDFQFFCENNGERKLDDLINNFVEDEATFAFVHWVREDQSIREIKVLKQRLDEDLDHIPQLLPLLESLFPKVINAVLAEKDSSGWIWEVDYNEDDGTVRTARVEFFERDDGKLEAIISRKATIFDGPSIEVLDYEDVVYPHRSADLQPPGASNPLGAAYVDRLCKTSMDSVMRRVKDGTYDLLEEEDIEAIKKAEPPTGGDQDETPKEQKDELEGRNGWIKEKTDEKRIVERYGRWDVDGDGLEEDVIFWVFRDAKKLAKACLLSEMYPGVPVLRPIVSSCFWPISNRVDGISLPELLESLQLAMQRAMNQNQDWGALTNMPFGFYRASSGMKPEPIFIEPGLMVPLDNPADVNFPQFPQRGETFTINTMTLLQQFVEKLPMQSDASYGRVPAGKASAFRVSGTVMALLGQTDVASEQILRRLFAGLAQIHQLMHRLNRHFLPDKKEIRIFGMAEKGQDAYIEISTEKIDADVDFEFKATLLNTNKQVVAEGLREVAALIISPLAIQMGIVTSEKVHNLLRDMIKSRDFDPERYTERPPQMAQGPSILAEEAFTAIMAGEMPVGKPLEGAGEHLTKLIEFKKAADKKGQETGVPVLSEIETQMFMVWFSKVRDMAMAEMQRQQMLQAAQQFQQTAGANGAGAPGGVPPGINQGIENPPVQPGEKIDESLGMQ